MDTITSAMLKQHQEINDILLRFEQVPEEETSRVRQVFDVFKENLSKHILIEEENIFPVSNNNTNESRILQNLLNEHKDIRGIVENLDEEINSGRKPNTQILRELLFSHEGRETQSFYPLLDARLPNETKMQILEKLKDVKIGYYS